VKNIFKKCNVIEFENCKGLAIMESLPITTTIGILGFLLGGIFGATAQRTNFCTMGSISDMVFMGSWDRFRAWILAMAIAILGTQLLASFSLIDLTKSIYLTPSLGWAGAIIGGLLFGFGMTLGGGCGSKTLVRLGGGNLKSVVVALFLGIFAYMTLRGLIGIARLQLETTNIDLTGVGLKSQSIPGLLEAARIAPSNAQWIVTGAVVAYLLWFCFKCPSFRASQKNIAGGLIIGLLTPVGWYITGVIGFDEFEPTALASVTFVAPVGQGLQYLMTFTGSTINFGIATVGGVIMGAFIAAKASGDFRFESFTDVSDMGRHIIGGSMMGTGGVLALGCTIGQGITGMSTLAIGSVIAFASIICGGVYGMKYLEEGSLGAALKAMCSKS
jgi:uncharacterized protein